MILGIPDVSRVGALCALLLLCMPVLAHADSPLSVVPAVVDEKAAARDILKETLSLTNNSDHKLFLYPSVNNVDAIDGEQAFRVPTDSAQRSNSLANWIELSRGVVEIGPGETKEVPYIIRVNLNAIPGTYHARISFGDGSTRDEAETHELAVVMVNLEVKADTKEILQLNKFYTDSIFFSGDDVLFNFQVQNIGNQDLQPTGEIRIYDRKGQEVASVDVNRDGKVISPDQLAQLASVWSGAKGFGKYKALLTVDYGKGQVASVQDTVFFWIVPWQQLLALFVGSLITVVFFALYFHRLYERRYTGRVTLGEIAHHLPHSREALHASVVSIPNAQAPTPVFDRPTVIGKTLVSGLSMALAAGASIAALPALIANSVSQRAARRPRVSLEQLTPVVPPAAPALPQSVPAVPAQVAVPVATAPLQDVAVPAPAPSPVPPVYVPPPVPPAPAVSSAGSTINLKSIRPAGGESHYAEGHVISLKKRS